MSAIELLHPMTGIDPRKLTREENFILEIEIFSRLCKEIEEKIQTEQSHYHRLLHHDREKESNMLEDRLVRHIIHDILQTEEYSLEGIAYYTQIPEEVLHDILAGKNLMPSLPLARKIIELHRCVKSGLYQDIIKKIAEKCASENIASQE